MLKPNYTPLEITLVRRGVNRQQMRNELKLSGVTLAKIAKGEHLSMRVLAQICEYLKAPLHHVVFFEGDEEYNLLNSVYINEYTNTVKSTARIQEDKILQHDYEQAMRKKREAKEI